MDSYRHSQWKKRRSMDELGVVMSLLPDWLLSATRKRSTKLRMRVAVSLATGLLVIYVIVSHAAAPPGGYSEYPTNRLDRHLSDSNVNKRNWRISDKSRRKPVAVDKIVDSQAHAPQRVQLLAPLLQQDEKHGGHVPPGFVGVGGEGKVLQPPPGPALKQRTGEAGGGGGHSRMGPEDRLNPRMRVGGIDPADPGGGGQGGVRVNPRNVGPPGQSHAMHLVEGAADFNDRLPAKGVLVAPEVDSAAIGSPYRGAGSYGAQFPAVSTKETLPRYVYLDLRVGPPKVAYLIQLLPILANLGAVGVILEYEANFPYKGPLSVLASPKAYAPSDIQRIVSRARESSLDVIPLVQTFSNTEFILKHKQFDHLVERPRFLQNLNPLKNGTLVLVSQMLHQVLDVHPGVRTVHVGCEEVYHLGYSPESRTYLAQTRGAKVADLYLNHVTAVGNLVRLRHPGKRVIIWDNVISSISASILKRHTQLGALIEPMISMSSLEVSLPADVTRKYVSAFQSVWVATTFNSPIPNIAVVPSFYKYISHQRSWLEKLSQLRTTPINIRGVALVGHFRLTHFSPVPAVLLPVALPSLGLCLRTVTRGGFNRSVFDDVMTALECHQQRPISDEDLWESFTWCTFPGSALFRDFVEARQNVLLIKQIINTQGQKDVSPIVRKFEELLTRLPRHLVSIYDREVALEWLEFHVVNNLSALGGFKTKAKSMLASNQWLKRPKRSVMPPANLDNIEERLKI